MRTLAIAAAAALIVATGSARAAEIDAMITTAMKAAIDELAAAFERDSGHKLRVVYGPSGGLARRFNGGEGADLIVIDSTVLDELIKQGKVVAGSRVDLVRSLMGMAVRAGAPRPDITSVEAFKQTLLRAKSIAISSSASGLYLSTEVFERLGIAGQMKGKTKISEEAVGTLVANGDAEIGFQQISELLPVPGIDYVGPLPAGVQRETVFSAGIVSGARAPDAARALITFFASPAAAPAIRKTGLEPMTSIASTTGR